MTPTALKSARRALGLSARGLGEALGVNPRTIRRWERGDSPIPQAVALALPALTAAASTPPPPPTSSR